MTNIFTRVHEQNPRFLTVYVFYFDPNQNIWLEKHLAFGGIPKLKLNLQKYMCKNSSIFLIFEMKSLELFLTPKEEFVTIC